MLGPSRDLPQGNGVLRRIDEVFDCWFESGSMPYAQKHYPFEQKVFGLISTKLCLTLPIGALRGLLSR